MPPGHSHGLGGCPGGSSPIFPLPLSRSEEWGRQAGELPKEAAYLAGVPVGARLWGQVGAQWRRGGGRDDGRESAFEHLGKVPVPVI